MSLNPLRTILFEIAQKFDKYFNYRSVTDKFIIIMKSPEIEVIVALATFLSQAFQKRASIANATSV